MNSLVPHLWGLSFMYTLIRLNVERDGSMASSKAITAGGVKPFANRCWRELIMGRSFQARSAAAAASSLALK
ncbi:hypothetical protein PHMEG_00041221 [Phytophthora megakarya]|uniref:Uncharacterized protein n=1 Tax=Phytophthora megakarya TaxID=4795 RepID=A0A225UDA2_9STRA|nr:hypothetical protein PHMEG_00041221 [Phytophthora megakarya]